MKTSDGLEQGILEIENSRGMKIAAAVDNINKVLGTSIIGLQSYFPIGSTGYGIAELIRLFQYMAIKIPLIVSITAKSPNEGLGLFLVETGKYAMPYGSIGDWVNLYSNAYKNARIKQLLQTR